MSCSAIIVAAGNSRRMGFDKLTAELAGIPVLSRAVAAFLAAPSVSEIIVVTSAERFDQAGLGDLTGKPVRRVAGGIERRYSVENGLAVASGESTLIAVHDGARPLISTEAIEECIASAREFGAAAIARRVTETMMRGGSDRFTRAHIDRTDLWFMETPQIFRARILRRAYENVRERGAPVTDEVSAVDLLGISSYLVETRAPNPKITLPGDIAMAERLLA